MAGALDGESGHRGRYILHYEYLQDRLHSRRTYRLNRHTVGGSRVCEPISAARAAAKLNERNIRIPRGGRWFDRIKVHLPRVRAPVHACMSASTILAPRNTPPGTVYRILGHASFATTMRLYGGLTSEALQNAAGTLGDAFERPDKNRTNKSPA